MWTLDILSYFVIFWSLMWWDGDEMMRVFNFSFYKKQSRYLDIYLLWLVALIIQQIFIFVISFLVLKCLILYWWEYSLLSTPLWLSVTVTCFSQDILIYNMFRSSFNLTYILALPCQRSSLCLVLLFTRLYWHYLYGLYTHLLCAILIHSMCDDHMVNDESLEEATLIVQQQIRQFCCGVGYHITWVH